MHHWEQTIASNRLHHGLQHIQAKSCDPRLQHCSKKLFVLLWKCSWTFWLSSWCMFLCLLLEFPISMLSFLPFLHLMQYLANRWTFQDLQQFWELNNRFHRISSILCGRKGKLLFLNLDLLWSQHRVLLVIRRLYLTLIQLQLFSFFCKDSTIKPLV